ncbi:SymE family type I addiction module toxin [Pantoea sp. T14]
MRLATVFSINWLAEAGFGTDTPVTIAVERGQLVIRLATE